MENSGALSYSLHDLLYAKPNSLPFHAWYHPWLEKYPLDMFTMNLRFKEPVEGMYPGSLSAHLYSVQVPYRQLFLVYAHGGKSDWEQHDQMVLTTFISPIKNKLNEANCVSSLRFAIYWYFVLYDWAYCQFHNETLFSHLCTTPIHPLFDIQDIIDFWFRYGNDLLQYLPMRDDVALRGLSAYLQMFNSGEKQVRNYHTRLTSDSSSGSRSSLHSYMNI